MYNLEHWIDNLEHWMYNLEHWMHNLEHWMYNLEHWMCNLEYCYIPRAIANVMRTVLISNWERHLPINTQFVQVWTAQLAWINVTHKIISV